MTEIRTRHNVPVRIRGGIVTIPTRKARVRRIVQIAADNEAVLFYTYPMFKHTLSLPPEKIF